MWAGSELPLCVSCSRLTEKTSSYQLLEIINLPKGLNGGGHCTIDNSGHLNPHTRVRLFQLSVFKLYTPTPFARFDTKYIFDGLWPLH